MLYLNVAFDIYLSRADGSGVQSCANVSHQTELKIKQTFDGSKKIKPCLFQSDLTPLWVFYWNLISNVTSTLHFTEDAAVQMSSPCDRPLRLKHS